MYCVVIGSKWARPVILKSFALGRLEGGNVRLLGTGFFVRQNILATAAHVLDGNDAGLVAVVPEAFNNDLNAYQHQPRRGTVDYLTLGIEELLPNLGDERGQAAAA